MNTRLRRGFAAGVVAAAVLYGLAPVAAHEYPRNRRPDTGKRIIIIPPNLYPHAPRTAIDAARAARLADEAANTRMAGKWAKLLKAMGDGTPDWDDTGKVVFKGPDGTTHSFHSYDTARESWGAMINVYDFLSRGDVKGAKKIWKKAKKDSETLWYGRQDGERLRDIVYDDEGKDAKAHGDADETAQNDILDGLWYDLKGAEAAGLKPVKASAPSKK